MLKLRKIFAFGAVLLATAFSSLAQERDEFGYNQNSLRPIHNDDQFFKKTLWFRIDLKEKQNKALFARNMEITKAIIEATKAGILRPYTSDSLQNRMSNDQFLENLTIPGQDAGLSEEEKAMGFGESDDGWGDDPWGGGKEGEGGGAGGDKAAASNEYFAKDFTLLELREDLIFDKKRSRMYHDIQAITIILPADKNPTGVEKPIASFSYKELVENVFRDNPNAIWYNNQNPREHRSLEEAFELRLFAAHLTKYANSDDSYIEDIYGSGKAAIVSSMQYEHSLLEYESDFWEN
jgi:gliding motility associated protien GldN